MTMMGTQMNNQTNQMQQIIEKLEEAKHPLSADNNNSTVIVPIECGSHQLDWDNTSWTVTGVSFCIPDPDHD